MEDKKEVFKFALLNYYIEKVITSFIFKFFT